MPRLTNTPERGISRHWVPRTKSRGVRLDQPTRTIDFAVDEAPEGGFIARAVGADILTEADDLPSLRAQVLDAVHCHFEEGRVPSFIRLHIASESAWRDEAPLAGTPTKASS